MLRISRHNGKGEKLCSHPTCPVVIGATFLMCLKHWNAVPKPLRLKIWAARRQWQADPSNAGRLHTLQQLQAEAIALVS